VIERGHLQKRHPALTYLLSAYFHQDWALDDGTVQGVLARFRREESDELVAESATAAAVLLATYGDKEEALREALEALGAQIVPHGVGLTSSEFLEQIAELE
jgi:CdiI immunity protein